MSKKSKAPKPRKIREKSVWEVIKEYLIVTLGVLIYTVAWNIFIVPNDLVGGGVSGLATIVYYVTNGGIPVGYTYFAVNVLLLAVAFKILGKSFGGKTIYAIIIASIFFRIMPEILPADFVYAIAVANGKMISVLIGAAIVGLSIGITMSVQGSTGGTDIVALIVCKYKNASPGKVILISDLIIVTSLLFFPIHTSTGELMGLTQKVATVVYGYVQIVVVSYTVDLFLSGTKQCVQVFIFSKKYEELADAITVDLKRGVTLIPSVGWYTKQESNVLMVVTRKSDLNILLKYVKFIDSSAFISVASVMGVFGNGFDQIKMKAEVNKK